MDCCFASPKIENSDQVLEHTINISQSNGNCIITNRFGIIEMNPEKTFRKIFIIHNS